MPFAGGKHTPPRHVVTSSKDQGWFWVFQDAARYWLQPATYVLPGTTNKSPTKFLLLFLATTIPAGENTANHQQNLALPIRVIRTEKTGSGGTNVQRTALPHPRPFVKPGA
ncbi:unnamed protein product, partial [Ectocarpus sp. 12 AP-2014]